MNNNPYLINGTSTSTILGPVTIEEKAQKKIDVKARSILLMALLNEHLLTFSQYKDAKTLFEAIQARFGGNDATKKTKRTLLKQMYENFNAPSTDDATVYAFLVNQPNGSQLVREDLEQIHKDDLEEMDLKWQLALLSMRARRSPRNQESRPRNQDSSTKIVNMKDTSSKAMVAIDEVGFDWSYMVDDEVSTNMALMTFSDLEGDPQDALKDQGYFESGCSKHMTGNISYLTDFKEHDRVYVAFGGGAKGGKITGKGTIRTGKLDFEDVYFVKELQFNLFSVSQ
nr:ribonuclease H-like domain-containing protein [Tanacetum cinerariifolium]